MVDSGNQSGWGGGRGDGKGRGQWPWACPGAGSWERPAVGGHSGHQEGLPAFPEVHSPGVVVTEAQEMTTGLRSPQKGPASQASVSQVGLGGGRWGQVE